MDKSFFSGNLARNWVKTHHKTSRADGYELGGLVLLDLAYQPPIIYIIGEIDQTSFGNQNHEYWFPVVIFPEHEICRSLAKILLLLPAITLKAGLKYQRLLKNDALGAK